MKSQMVKKYAFVTCMRKRVVKWFVAGENRADHVVSSVSAWVLFYCFKTVCPSCVRSHFMIVHLFSACNPALLCFLPLFSGLVVL